MSTDRLLIHDATLINEGKSFTGHLLIKGNLIEDIFTGHHPFTDDTTVPMLDATGLLLIPGVIDDQVHFREPGLTHKGDIYSESRAAAAGGVTSFMDMPNTVPQTTTRSLLEQKFGVAAEASLVNYSFYLGATNENLEEIRNVDVKNVCGIKVFMGASTGNMLVDQPRALEGIFREAPMLIAIHSEHEPTIQANLEKYKQRYGEEIPWSCHPLIRSAEACLRSTEIAVDLAKKYGSRLHILHLSTGDECNLLSPGPVKGKRITAEVCVHHLWFDDSDYAKLGSHIKWNPAIKTKKDQEALWKALADGRIDVIATDHAPHTLEEKDRSYFKAPSGGPLIQHSLLAMLEKVRNGDFTMEQVVEKMCHNVALCFDIQKRGYLRKGYFADVVLIDPKKDTPVTQETLLYKCQWSPFEGTTFHHAIHSTFVNGKPVFQNGELKEPKSAMPLTFNR